MKIRGILFDLDGTLIDTIDLIIQAFEHSFAVCLNKKDATCRVGEIFWAAVTQCYGKLCR